MKHKPDKALIFGIIVLGFLAKNFYRKQLQIYSK